MPNDRKSAKEENARRVDELINLVDKHTRTERHLEQHSDIASPDNVQHSKEIQQIREKEINHLKIILTTGQHSDSELENLKRNYNYTEGYLTHNAKTMDPETLKNTQEKQSHRKDQMDFLE